MTQCPQCLNELENARTCNVCGMVNMRYKPPQKNWIPMSGGGFFNGISGNYIGDPYKIIVPSTYTTPEWKKKQIIEEMEVKKESIFSKIKTLYHKFD